MTRIEWTNRIWNPITGCTPVSAGCDNCYARRMAKRLQGAGVTGYETVIGRHGWTGAVELVESRLQQPLRWRKPRRIFVCSMGDLFYEGVPFDFIDRVFAVAALCPQHTFQVLTKRAERLLNYLTASRGGCRGTADRVSETCGDHFGWEDAYINPVSSWPLPNVWLGVTVEDQAAADERVPLLLQTPAAVRFVSCEPLLGPVNIFGDGKLYKALKRLSDVVQDSIHQPRIGVDWVIVGGETVPGARPMHPDWARSLRDQCIEAEIPFFFKQWGGPRTPLSRQLDGREWNEYPNGPA